LGAAPRLSGTLFAGVVEGAWRYYDLAKSLAVEKDLPPIEI